MASLKFHLLSMLWVSSTCYGYSYFSFPKNFKFGVATSAYQIEGAWNVNGKGPSFWDYITHNRPTMFANNATGDIACDSYHKYKEDVQLIRKLGVDFYRFSLSWPRILPSGRVDDVNPDGIRYYNALIDELIKCGITPMVTLYHWDLPLALYQNGSIANEDFPKYFAQYAELAFRTFGDRVKHWFTFNEPNNCCLSLNFIDPLNDKFYTCTRNLLRAHGKAWRIYNETYRAQQRGKIAMVIDSYWYEPASEKPEDIAAADRFMDFKFGIWAHPIYFGDYPKIMKTYVADMSARQGFAVSRLPKFSQEEIDEIRGTHDFFALNHYTTQIVAQKEASVDIFSVENDAAVRVYQLDTWEVPKNYSVWLKVVPWGFRKCLKYVKDNLNNPEIIITENGYSDTGETNDIGRINYYQEYLSALLESLYLDRVRIKGYTAWSLMDNFEWLDGYQSKFGFYKVDFDDPNRTRTPKASAKYYANLIRTRQIPDNRGLTLAEKIKDLISKIKGYANL